MRAPAAATRPVRWSSEPEMEAWMLANDRGQGTAELSAEFEAAWGFPLSRPQISLFRATHGTQARRSRGGGRRPVPVGSESLQKDGYVVVKVAERPTVPQSKDNWRFKHWVAWERANGATVPDGWTVVFCDGDIRNFDPENLEAIPRRYIGPLNNMRARGVAYCDKPTLHACMAVVDLRSAAIDAENARPRRCEVCGREFVPDGDRHMNNRRTCRECLGEGRKAKGVRRVVGRAACAVCGREFEKTSRHQVRCAECIAEAPRLSAAAQAAGRRCFRDGEHL